MTTDADGERHDDRARQQHRRGVGEVEPQVAQELEEAHTEADARQQPEQRRDRRHQERLEHHRPHDLPAGRAHRPQQPELAGALGHQDRERVEDDEGADDHADRGEPEQRVGEEPEELADRLAHLRASPARAVSTS